VAGTGKLEKGGKWEGKIYIYWQILGVCNMKISRVGNGRFCAPVRRVNKLSF
jgi:hypothetical protein